MARVLLPHVEDEVHLAAVVEFDGEEVAAKDVAMHVAAMKPVALSSADVPAELVAKERSVAEGKADEANKELVAAGKPAQSAEITAKRIDGAVQKVTRDYALCKYVAASGDHDFMNREGIDIAASPVSAAQLALLLQRIADGSYGECVDCGAHIAEARLRAAPASSTVFLYSALLRAYLSSLSPPPPPSPPSTTPAQEEVHLNQVAHVIEMAQLVLGSEAAALTWLKAPHLALGGLAPMNVMSTDAGAAQVLRLLDNM